MKKKICIVLPCYKVKNNILKVYKKLKKIKIDYLIFVDDKCPQQSVYFLKSKIKKDKNVKFIFLKKNLGVGGATLKGISFAYNQGFDIMIKFDSDNQHKITDLLKIKNILLKNHVDFCKGYRSLSFTDSFKRKMPLIRIIGANALTYLSNITTGNFNTKDVTNGLFGFNKKILNKIKLKKLKTNYFFEQDLIFRLSQHKIKIHQIKSEVIYKDEISSLNTLNSVIPFLFYHFQNLLNRLKNST